MAWGRRNEPVKASASRVDATLVAEHEEFELPEAPELGITPERDSAAGPASAPEQEVAPKREAAKERVSAPKRESSAESTLQSVGKSVQVKGELTGSENVWIDGSFEGTIRLPDHRLVVGRSGHVHADVEARAVVVEGEVVGNITASDRVEISATGSVLGDLRAARVVLADGARFKGSIDMGAPAVDSMAVAEPMAAASIENALSSVFDAKD
jgi:cytoskeletal protein CcmA (bactofilin family)